MNTMEDFQSFYLQHRDFVRAVLFRLVGNAHLDDATQECFLKIWKARSSFKGESSLKTWIHRIAVNVAYDTLRSNKGKTLEVSLEKEQSMDPKDSLAQRDLQRVLLTLPMEYRSVVVLSMFQELSEKEVSESLEIPLGTVKSRLSRGKEMMKEVLTSWGYSV